MLKKTVAMCLAALLVLSIYLMLYIAVDKNFFDVLIYNTKPILPRKESSKGAALFDFTIDKKNDLTISPEVNVKLYQTYTEKELLSAAERNCSYVQTLSELDKIIIPNGTLVDLGSYKKKKREGFLKNYQHPPPKKMNKPTVKLQLVCFVSSF